MTRLRLSTQIGWMTAVVCWVDGTEMDCKRRKYVYYKSYWIFYLPINCYLQIKGRCRRSVSAASNGLKICRKRLCLRCIAFGVQKAAVLFWLFSFRGVCGLAGSITGVRAMLRVRIVPGVPKTFSCFGVRALFASIALLWSSKVHDDKWGLIFYLAYVQVHYSTAMAANIKGTSSLDLICELSVNNGRSTAVCDSVWCELNTEQISMHDSSTSPKIYFKALHS